jgi:hypothetical protein
MVQPIDPRQLRPRRRWYGIAVLVAVLFTAGGVGAFTLGLVSAVKSIPQFTYALQGAASDATVELNAGTYGVYVPEAAPTTCTYGDGVRSSEPSATLTFTRNGQSWVWVSNITVDARAKYQVSCDSGTFAIGEKPEVGQFAGGLAGGILALAGLPCIGITIGGIIALVTGLRRSSHKKRLLSTPTW